MRYSVFTHASFWNQNSSKRRSTQEYNLADQCKNMYMQTSKCVMCGLLLQYNKHNVNTSSKLRTTWERKGSAYWFEKTSGGKLCRCQVVLRELPFNVWWEFQNCILGMYGPP